jgi:hypothetical protein
VAPSAAVAGLRPQHGLVPVVLAVAYGKSRSHRGQHNRGILYMPEIILCRYCKQSINKDVDDYVVMRHAAARFTEELAHAACEQKQPASFVDLGLMNG